MVASVFNFINNILAENSLLKENHAFGCCFSVILTSFKLLAKKQLKSKCFFCLVYGFFF